MPPLDRKVLLAGRYAQVFGDPLRAELGSDWCFDAWEARDGMEALIARASQAEVIIGSSEWAREHEGSRAKASFEAARALRVVIIPFSGMDWLQPSWVPPECAVCNINSGVDPIAEYVLCAMLNHEIRLQEMDTELRQHSWSYGGGTVMGRPHGELQGKTIGLVGFGRIGQRVAQLCSAFRMKAVAVSRTPSKSSDLVWWRNMDGLMELLALSDYVLLTVPGGSETVDLIGEREICGMKSTAVLINVARGSVVNEEALYNALRGQRIGGAIVDTWYSYPTHEHPFGPPSRFAFEALNNVVMTPHAAGWTDVLETRRIATVLNQVRCYLRGQLIENVVVDTRRSPALSPHNSH